MHYIVYAIFFYGCYSLIKAILKGIAPKSTDSFGLNDRIEPGFSGDFSQIKGKVIKEKKKHQKKSKKTAQKQASKDYTAMYDFDKLS